VNLPLRGQLNFYNWDTYIGPTTLADFTHATGVPVRMSLFANNEELFTRLRTGNPGFDVIVPSDEFVVTMRTARMLAPLDHSKIPNFANVMPEFRSPSFDEGRRYSMPYTWLVHGIGYRKSRVSGVPDSWRWLFDSDRYAGRISLSSEPAVLYRLAAKYLGHSLNEISGEIASQIEQMLIRQRPRIRSFDSDDGQDLLAAREADLVMEYNGDIANVMESDNDLDFIVPREGSLLTSDSLCMPVGAPNPEAAHAFINFLLSGDAGSKITRTILYPTPNGAARTQMPYAYSSSPVLFPPPAVFERSEYATPLSQEATRRFNYFFAQLRSPR
jgi:spermidine/putrescine transport system substrate-binding protein